MCYVVKKRCMFPNKNESVGIFMLKIKKIRIKCKCDSEICLEESDFTPVEGLSRFSFKKKIKTPLVCSRCNQNGLLTVCVQDSLRTMFGDYTLSVGDLEFVGDFTVVEWNVSVLKRVDVDPHGKNIQDFIDDSMHEIYNSFFVESQNKGFCLNGSCVLNFNFLQDHCNEIDYSRKDVQQFYLLRYFYAYFVEYMKLYSEIDLDKYHIFSIGCGSFLDYYGFRYAKGPEVSCSYLGIDCIDWKYKNLIPYDDRKVKFLQKSLLDCVYFFRTQGLDKALGFFNVFMFPKSIEYLENEENGAHDLSLLADAIKETNFKFREVYLILNGMNEKIEDDEEKLYIIKEAFLESGFQVEGEELKFDGSKDSLYKLSGKELRFPNTIKGLIEKICNKCVCSQGCFECSSLKSYPMLNAVYFKYRIIKLVKK